MDATVFSAIIVGGAGVISTLIPIVVENKRFAAVSAMRRKQVAGAWRGVTKQAEGPAGEPIEVQLYVEFKISWRRIRAEARVVGGGTELHIQSRGGFINDEYMVLNYRSRDPAIVNFGTGLLRLHANGKRMSGLVVGYGSEREGMIHGQVEYEKIE